MRGLLDRILARAPLAEVAARQIYWKVPAARRLLRTLRARRPANIARGSMQHVDLADLVDTLRQLGVSSGDLLIVHASTAVIEATGKSPRDINAALRDALGPAGTLAMPGFPLFRNEPAMHEQICGTPSLPIHDYDPVRTPIWTGLLALDLLRTKGAMRSSFPINPLIAMGADVPAMFESEWREPVPTACGAGSAWQYAVDRGAKVVMLGVDVAHSLTLNHVAEDGEPAAWPIAGWYRQRDYRVRINDMWVLRTVRERCPRWALHYCERALNAAMLANGHLRMAMLGDLSIGVVDAQAHLAFLQARRATGFPYFGVSTRDRGGNASL